MRRTLSTVMTTGMLLLLSVAISVAQGMCDGFADRALQAVDESCNEVGRNQACYGFNLVEASFQNDVDDDFFTEPSDITEVASIETVRTAPLDLETDEWGVAVMVLQANMPETLPGQNVTFILMGDAEIENAVASDEAYEPISGISVEVTFPQGAAIRSGPGDNFNTVDGVVVGTVFTADGISVDGNWLRVVWDGRPAWIRRTTVEAIPEIETLPTLDSTLRTPMQAFYLTTGIGSPACSEVPDSSLFVQGPDDIEIDLTVNGANILLGSSGILRVIEDSLGQPQMEIIVLDGEFVIQADEFNPQDVVIRAGQRSTFCLSTEGENLGVDGEADDLTVTCGASPPETIDIAQFIADWCSLESLPSSLLFYDVLTCSARTHTVSAGENLFRISQFYCVAQDDLAALNGITDPTQLVVGQVLNLPPDACDGNGSTRPPNTPNTNTGDTTDETGQEPTSCGLTLISPLGNVNSGNHTFSWTPIAGDNVTYVLQFVNFEGIDVESFTTSDTSYTLNLGRQTSTGGQFQWRVDAVQNGQFVCSSRTSPVLVRTGELNPPDDNDDSGFSLSVSCSFGGTTDATATASWSNLPAGQSVSLQIQDSFGTFATGGPFTTTSDTQTITLTTAYTPANATVTTSGGASSTATCTP
ncbi:MAG: LysM domain-containing protein [Chloroflexota bacterium]